jgi:hypothetical protein
MAEEAVEFMGAGKQKQRKRKGLGSQYPFKGTPSVI